MIRFQVIQSVVLLSILQAVFSKRCSDSLHQTYLASSTSHTKGHRHCDSISKNKRHDYNNSESFNSFYLRKRGLAFVHSKAKAWKYLHQHRKQPSISSFTEPKSGGMSNMNNVKNSIASWNISFDRPSSKRSLFSFNLNDVDWDENKKMDKNDRDSGDNANRATDANMILEKDQRDERKEESNNISKNFPFASLINVEALLMASEKMPLNEEADPGTSLLIDMMTEVQTSKVNNNLKSNAVVGSGGNTKDGESETENGAAVKGDEILFDPTWDNFVRSMQQNVKDLVESPSNLKEATQSLESFMNEATASFSPDRVQSLIRSLAVDLAVYQNAGNWKTTVDSVVEAAEKIAREQGLDVSTAAAQARATTKYTTEFLQIANGVLLSGYVADESITTSSDSSNSSDLERRKDLAREMSIPLMEGEDGKMSNPLFHSFPTVTRIPRGDFHQVSRKGAEMAKLSGAIYQDTIPIIHSLGHSMVANSTTANVRWMVSDSVGYESDFERTSSVDRGNPIIVRTITIRGFDASDESVDRELLLNNICAADPVKLSEDYPTLGLHRGLLGIAKEIYSDILPYISGVGPMHKIVLTGHSIGGAIANLILFLLTAERGNIYVQDKVKRVFTYGSPPIAVVDKDASSTEKPSYHCSVLDTLGLPSDMVFGYIQPLDPIVRFLSRIDSLYPLIGDLGPDGVTLYASGPPRTLRPVTRTILEAWEDWPAFRDNYRGVLDQNYSSIGIQHLMMPDTGRYLADRLVNVNINAYEVDEVLRVSSDELYGALEHAFPLDTFQVSLVPTAIRSFVHHFFPAYSEGFEGYVSATGGDRRDDVVKNEVESKLDQESSLPTSSIVDSEIESVKKLKLKSPTDQFGLWVLGGNEV